MNRFRKLGFIDYNGRIHVHESLLKAVLNDHMPDDNASKPSAWTAAQIGNLSRAISADLSQQVKERPRTLIREF
jgi:hypothetical protein